MAGSCILASCDNKVVADGDEAGAPLPEGMYPLTFTAIQTDGTPKTRVSENSDGMSSKWDGGETIGVQITGSTKTGIYTLDGTGNATPQTPVYWENTQQVTVNAWFPTDETVSLQDQSSKLAYVLKGSGTGRYSSTATLTFTHQLAKVRVALTGTAIEPTTSPTVSILGYTACTNRQGSVTGSGDAKTNYISTHPMSVNGTTYYEANVVPQDMSTTDKFIKIVIGKNIFYYKPTDNNIGKLHAGNIHTYTITVNKPGPITYPTGSIIPTITDDGEYIIEGNGSETTNGIIIQGSPTVTLKNVNISSSLGIEIKGGTPTILIDGTNQLRSSGGSGIALTSEDANVIIKGSGTNPSLTVTGGYYQAGIGGNDNSFGNIRIEDITLVANGHEAAPGIGSGLPAYDGELKKSGWIYIKNCAVTASGQYDSYYNVSPASIGNASIAGGASLEQGDITIDNTSLTKSKILETLTQLSGSHKIGNGTGGSTSAGTIKIGTIKIIASDGTFTDNGNGYIDN